LRPVLAGGQLPGRARVERCGPELASCATIRDAGNRLRAARAVRKASMDDKTRGAWVIHHADKLRQVKDPGTFENILVAGKAATVLSAIAATDEIELSVERVRTLAKANGVNRLELESVLDRLEVRHLIERNRDSVQVVGVTTSSVIQHTAKLLDDSYPTAAEQASLQLAEITSHRPLPRHDLAEQLGDECRMASAEVDDLLFEAEQIGFVDVEPVSDDKLYFNGNLFRRDHVAKTQRVLDSLDAGERQQLQALEQELLARGCISLTRAEQILGSDLTS